MIRKLVASVDYRNHIDLMNRRIRIPWLLRALHGEESTPAELFMTYAAALITAAIIVTRAAARPAAVTWWEITIVALLGADIAAGAVATFTPGTDRFYSARPRLRIVFILLHALHPLVLFFIIGGPVEVWAAIPGYAIVSALVVNVLTPRLQQMVAPALVALGIVICFSWLVIAPPALWFGPLFLVKLVLGFAVRRSELTAVPETGS